jgi:hypothetical protein
MFNYFYSHGHHMFRVPSVLGMQFGNHWRYICCLLVQWLFLVRWFIGSSVATYCCLVQVCEFEVLQLQLGLFMLPRWFVSFCFLLFSSIFQGWGPAPIVGAIFFSLCGVQVLHLQVYLQFCHFSCVTKSRSNTYPVPTYPTLNFFSIFFS